MKKIKKLENKKLLVLSVSAVLLLAGGAFAFTKFNDAASNEVPKPTAELNLDPPTEEEIKASNDNKQAIAEREERIQNQSSSEPGKKSVKPIITYAGQFAPQNHVEVGGYVSDIFEEGGICKATFSHGSSSFSKQTQAIRNAKSVDCPAIKASASEFSPKGKWSVVLSYDSSTASGTSETKTIEVK